MRGQSDERQSGDLRIGRARQRYMIDRSSCVVFARYTSSRSRNVLSTLRATHDGGLATGGFTEQADSEMLMTCGLAAHIPYGYMPCKKERDEVFTYVVRAVIRTANF